MTETNETAVDTKASNDAAIDAAIEAAMGPDTGESEAYDEPEAEEASGEGEEENTGGSEESPGQAEEQRAPDEDKILRQWRLAGLPASAFGALSSEERSEWATSHAKTSSDVHRAFRERAELEKRLLDLETTKETEPDPVGVPTVNVDLAAKKQRLADLLGEDEAEALFDVAQELAQAQLAPLQVKMETASKQAEATLFRNSLQEELGANDPRLLDSKTFDQLEKVVDGLYTTPRYGEIVDNRERIIALFKDAASLMLAAGEPEEGEEADDTVVPKRTPTRPARASKIHKPKTRAEIMDLKIDAATRGWSAARIRKTYGG